MDNYFPYYVVNIPIFLEGRDQHSLSSLRQQVSLK